MYHDPGCGSGKQDMETDGPMFNCSARHLGKIPTAVQESQCPCGAYCPYIVGEVSLLYDYSEAIK